MNRPLGTHAPWAILDGFPPLLHVLVWVVLSITIVLMWRCGPVENTTRSSSALQNRVYKRYGAFLLLVGAAAGFLPSISLLLRTGNVWSVNRVAPHSQVDTSIYIHIPLAVVWSIAMALQLWSGGVGARRNIHRVVGWVAVLSGVIGISLVAGWIWIYFNDFANGFVGGQARAGWYTAIMGVGIAINAVMLVVCAKKREFFAHKDYALMALFWSLDPGVHRTVMWLMRIVSWDTWAPENTMGLGIALAKLPANLVLMVWAISMAISAGRLNRIIVANVAGQYLLFVLGSYWTMQKSLGVSGAAAVAAPTIAIGILTIGVARLRGLLRPI